MKKLLVCDVEGTIFVPHMIKDAQHHSYIWTAIASALCRQAEYEEIKTQEKWKRGGYGSRNEGESYVKWVNDTIDIHIKHRLSESKFISLIDKAPYVNGVEEFFAKLNRSKWIPILISGGIQNLNERACRDLGVDMDDSYASCKYFFDEGGFIDKELTFLNTCNFYGKQEIVKMALRKYDLSNSDWVFIGDGINDVSVSKWAKEQSTISIGIDPVPDLENVVTYVFKDFSHMMNDGELMCKMEFMTTQQNSIQSGTTNEKAIEIARLKVDKQVGMLKLEKLENRACERIHSCTKIKDVSDLRRFTGMRQLLKQGELSFMLTSKELGNKYIQAALLQPFCNAAEIMIYVCLALTEDNEYMEKLLSGSKTVDQQGRPIYLSMKDYRERVRNPDLRAVMKEYKNIRDISSHTAFGIPIDAAQTFIRRTYEIIQRLELIISSKA